MKGKQKKPRETVGQNEENPKELAKAAGEVVESLGGLDAFSAKAVLTVALSMVEATRESMVGRYSLHLAMKNAGVDFGDKAPASPLGPDTRYL